MSKTVILTLTTVETQLPVGGSFAGRYLYSLLSTEPGSAPVTQSLTTTAATFSGVAPGDYTASAQALDASGAPFGNVVSAPFTVAPDAPTTYAAPSGLTVSVA